MRRASAAIPDEAGSPIAAIEDSCQPPILVIEDNALDRRAIAKMLEGAGVRANLAGNGREALHMFKPFPYDMIPIDRRMPELDVLRRWFPAKTTEREHPAAGSLSEG
jgi:CheY-like chemotaxis protein